MTEKRNFKGIWIPSEIWLNNNLTLQEKVFLVEINSLDNSNGCFANNEYFANFFNLSKTRVSVVINSLVEKGFITSTLIFKEGTKQILKRVLNFSYIPYETNQGHPTLGKFKDNNTINNTVNNTINNISNSKEFSLSVKNCYLNCLKYFDKHLHPKNKKSWLETIDKLNRIDKIPFERIELITKWARTDNFWKTNFLSLTKLRKNQKSSGLKYIIVFNEKINNGKQNNSNKSHIERMQESNNSVDKFLSQQ